MDALNQYAAAGVDTRTADAGVGELVQVLRGIDTGRPSRTVPLPGHYASVVKVAENLGIALATDSVGSKVIIAEQLKRFDTIGIDCVAMNVNDLICVGAEPTALLDYIAVERADEAMLRELAVGLRAGAELAGVEIPGGEVCQVPEVLRGHPSPYGFDLVGSAFGTVALDAIVDGSKCRPGNVLIGLPASGVHSNGLTLARRVLEDQPEVLLEPTTIYVRAIVELVRSGLSVHGLAHITGGGVLNLLRLGDGVGYEITDPLPVTPVFELIASRGRVAAAEMWEVFNMGCGFCVIVAAEAADAAVALLAAHHPGTAVIGRLTGDAGRISLPGLGLAGDARGLVQAA
ncbi:MAG TPA: phosphoribosylformylglycinamidine cyclo-ligase [Solirubrobacteraceae bacterium]|nr:phosphoribosylformylglycinamidine cyclo-ligase [Solirubrobacteraceae bacterium]